MSGEGLSGGKIVEVDDLREKESETKRMTTI